MDVDVVVLAGGFGTRLRELVPDVPKPMAPVAGRPFLEILLTGLARQGVARAVLSLGHLAEVVTRHFGPRFEGMDLLFEVETQPLGTGGAIRAALRRCHGPAALVINGDTYLELDVAALWQAWRTSGRPLIVGREVEDTARFGRLRVEGRRLAGFAEKGAGGPGLINTGHYLLPTELFDRTPAAAVLRDPFSFEVDFLVPQVGSLGFDVFMTRGIFIDIGVPDDYRRAQTELAHLR